MRSEVMSKTTLMVQYSAMEDTHCVKLFETPRRSKVTMCTLPRSDIEVRGVEGDIRMTARELANCDGGDGGD